MKSVTGHFLLFAGLLFVSCSNSSTVKGKTQEAKDNTTNSSQTATTASSTSNQQVSGVVGYWKLALEAYDDNNNKKLDDEERKKGIQNRYSLRLNADGSCTIMDMYKGRYEKKTENGKEKLWVYRNRIPQEEDQDPVPDVYIITSMSKDEMVLLETLGDHVFWVFKRS